MKRGAYSLPAEKTVHVQIKTHGDTVIHDETLPLNAWGSFAGDFQLAPEPPLGGYTLEVEMTELNREYATFEVEAYRKPDFEVKVTVPAQHQLAGKPIPVKIAANYFFGSPVSRGTVNYNISFSEMGSSVPSHIITAAGLGSGATGSIEDNISGQGRLDANGALELSIPHAQPVL